MFSKVFHQRLAVSPFILPLGNREEAREWAEDNWLVVCDLEATLRGDLRSEPNDLTR